MSDLQWSTQEEYEALYGTQEEQASRQASVGVSSVDGPWRLVRWFETKEEAAAAVAGLLGDGVTVLVKASRGEAFETLLPVLGAAG